MRVLVAALAYVAVLAAVAAVAFFVLMLLAGPQGDLWPGALHAVVVLSVLAVPTLAARGVWRCLAPRRQ